MKFGIASRLALLLALVGILAAGFTGFYAYDASRSLLIDSAKNELLTSTQVLSRRIVLAREQISRDVRILAEHPAALAILQGGGDEPVETLATVARVLMSVNPGYFQIRLISASDNGKERVRIDRDGARLVRVRGEDLQEKGHYAYVFDTLALPPGETYVSRIVINHEQGAHSAVGQPSLQLARPVFDAQGHSLGVAVIDVDLNGMFALLAADLPQDYRLFLTNARGDFLIHPDSTQTFGFDRGRRVRLQDSFAGTEALIDGRVDQILIETHEPGDSQTPLVAAFVCKKATNASGDTSLILGLAQPLEAIVAQADRLGSAMLKIVLGLCLACAVAAVMVARAVTHPINAMGAAVKGFSEQRGGPGLPLERRDEIGALARSFNQLREQIGQQLAELQRSRSELEHLSQHDTLTGLANRALFADRVAQALAAARRDGTRLALMFMDLDKFKPINDRFGHAIGDALLGAFADRIRSGIRESDTAARVGGDEFMVLLRDIHDNEDALVVANKIRSLVNEPFLVDGHTISFSISIGIAFYPEDGADITELSKHADQAMYRIKGRGADSVAFFDATLD